MQKIQQIWHSGLMGKLMLTLCGLVFLCCCPLSLVGRSGQNQAVAAVPTQVSAATAPPVQVSIAAGPTQTARVVVITATAASTAIEADTSTAVPPTATQAPTVTQAPTATPAPPTAIPTNTAVPSNETKYIGNSGNLRRDPRVDAGNVIGQVCQNDEIRVIETLAEWQHVVVSNTAADCGNSRVAAMTEGWVNNTLVVRAPIRPAVAPAPAARPAARPAAPSSNSGERTGAICRDGSRSSATGRGACSHHGGVAQWVTAP